MTFDEAYEELEREFEEEIEREGSIYLPFIRPKRPVDFVLVGMEPSLGAWASHDLLKAPGEACKKRQQGIKNFAWSMEDFILHYCAREYLCQGTATYYLTDLAKGATLTAEATTNRMARYEQWYPLLQKEIGLVAKPEAKIISIGNVVGSFLSEKALFSHAGTVLHYSSQASRSREFEPSRHPKLYADFSSSVESGHIIKTAKSVLNECKVNSLLRDAILGRLRRRDSLTESRKKLMFTYRVRFERIRTQERIGWRCWQRRFAGSMPYSS